MRIQTIVCGIQWRRQLNGNKIYSRRRLCSFSRLSIDCISKTFIIISLRSALCERRRCKPFKTYSVRLFSLIYLLSKGKSMKRSAYCTLFGTAAPSSMIVLINNSMRHWGRGRERKLFQERKERIKMVFVFIVISWFLDIFISHFSLKCLSKRYCTYTSARPASWLASKDTWK